MEYKVQIGSIAFQIETPFPYRWLPSDEEFFGWNELASRIVQVKISCNEIKLPNRVPDNDFDWISIWESENTEVRAYKAAFWPGHPLYAMSCCQNDLVEITFCGDISLWNHPNMQLWNLIHLEKYLLETDSIVLHSCYTMYQGKAILFTAPSGTGKTTQANIWKRCYGSEIINGDKCLLQYINGQWMAAGYPYHGSADECQNKSYPLEAIVIVRQSKNDAVETMNPVQKLGLVYSECTVNTWDSNRVNLTLNLLTDLIQKVPTVMLHCTMEDSAAHVLYEHLYGGKNGTV